MSAEEALETRVNVYSNVGVASIGLLSVAIAYVCALFAPHLVGIAGYVYCLIGVVEWQVGAYHGRARKRLQLSAA